MKLLKENKYNQTCQEIIYFYQNYTNFQLSFPLFSTDRQIGGTKVF